MKTNKHILAVFQTVSVLLLSCVSVLEGSSHMVRALTFGINPNFQHKIHKYSVIGTYKVNSEEECMLHCVADCNCLSFTFVKYSSLDTCHLESGWTNDIKFTSPSIPSSYFPVQYKDLDKRCMCDYYYKNISCFRLYNTDSANLFWNEASQYCRNMNMNLITIETVDEYDYLMKILNQISYKKSFWTSGIEDSTNKVYIWSNTNQPVAYSSKWGHNHPYLNNTKTACMMINNQLMYDVNCGQTLNFICEMYL